MLKDCIEDSFTFDDVILLLGHYMALTVEISIKSRVSQKLECSIPLLSVAMDTVSTHQTAICKALEEGIGIIRKNTKTEDQASQVKIIKRSQSGIIYNHNYG